MAKNPTAAELKPNAAGFVPIKFLGLPTDPDNPDQGRAGEAGLGLRVGEIRGVLPAVAARMIELGTAELVTVPEPKAAPVKA